VGLREQERALLALVFDPVVRAAFHADADAALAGLGVPPEDRAAFAGLSRAGLEVDARDRLLLVMGRLAASFSMTLAALSAFPAGLARASALVDPAHFAQPVDERPVRFGDGLRHAIETVEGPGPGERSLLRALVQWEAALAAIAAAARREATAGTLAAEPPAEEPLQGWRDVPLRLAPHVTLARFPLSLASLEKLLVPCAREQLWARLQRAPLPRARLNEALSGQGEGRLVVGRAVVLRASPTDAEVGVRTLELAAGFGAFLGRLDGTLSAAALLQQFARAGAQGQVLQGLEAGLHRLVRERVLMGCG
jgi:hypothetical protein